MVFIFKKKIFLFKLSQILVSVFEIIRGEEANTERLGPRRGIWDLFVRDFHVQGTR